MALGGNIGRFYTVLVEASDDWVYVSNSLMSMGLNIIIILQFIIYHDNNKAKERERIMHLLEQFDEKTKDQQQENLISKDDDEKTGPVEEKNQ